MICPHCDTENASKKFCTNCGNDMTRSKEEEFSTYESTVSFSSFSQNLEMLGWAVIALGLFVSVFSGFVEENPFDKYSDSKFVWSIFLTYLLGFSMAGITLIFYGYVIHLLERIRDKK